MKTGTRLNWCSVMFQGWKSVNTVMFNKFCKSKNFIDYFNIKEVLTVDVCSRGKVTDTSIVSPLGEPRLDTGKELCCAPCLTTTGENFVSDTAPPYPFTCGNSWTGLCCCLK